MLRKYRLAVSATGEFTAHFGGTISDALAAINATMTRVNMIFETDVAATFEIQDFNELIYTDAETDPYADADIGSNSDNNDTIDGWNIQLQNTLTSTIGNALNSLVEMISAASLIVVLGLIEVGLCTIT
mgnify:CR=1 FL=1